MKFFSFLSACFFICGAWAALPVSAQETLPSFDDAVIVRGTEQVTVESGKPIIFIDSLSDEKEQTAWQANQGQVQISTFGGQILEVPFITHIPQFSIYVQVLSDRSISVTERISLVLDAGQSTPFVRSYPLLFEDKEGRTKTRQVEFLHATYNNRPYMPNVVQTPDSMQVRFFENEGLYAGVHLFEVSYLIPNAVEVNGNTTHLFEPLLGTSLPYLAERVRIFISYPNQTKLSFASAVFGSNNQKQDDAVDIYMDENARLIYKIKGLLPAMLDVRVDILGNANGFEAETQNEAQTQNIMTRFAWLIVALICAFVTFIYFSFTALDLRDKAIDSKFLTRVRAKLFYDVGLLRWLLKHKTDWVTLFVYVLHLLHRGLVTVRINSTGQIVLLACPDKKKNRCEKRVLRFLFGRFGREVSLNNFAWKRQKIKRLHRLILKNIRIQILSFTKRELLIGLLLPLIGLAVLLHLKTAWPFILGAGVVMALAYYFSVIHFIHKGEFEALLAGLMKEYSARTLSQDKRQEVDIALDLEHTKEQMLPIIQNGHRISTKDFEQMFLSQLH